MSRFVPKCPLNQNAPRTFGKADDGALRELAAARSTAGASDRSPRSFGPPLTGWPQSAQLYADVPICTDLSCFSGGPGLFNEEVTVAAPSAYRLSPALTMSVTVSGGT